MLIWGALSSDLAQVKELSHTRAIKESHFKRKKALGARHGATIAREICGREIKAANRRSA